MTEFDDTLTRLFAETRETLPADDFLQRMATRLSQERRRRSIKRAILSTAAAGLTAALTPYVVAGSLAVASHVVAWLPSFGNELTSPIGSLCALTVVAWIWRHATHRAN